MRGPKLSREGEVPMKTIAFPGNLIERIGHCRPALKPRPLAADENWAMFKLIGWVATIAVLAFLMWQALAAQPLWPPTISVLLLVAVSVLAGLRLGADSAAAYTRDLHRLNKVLVDQNRELEQANAALLEQLSVEVTAPSKSA